MIFIERYPLKRCQGRVKLIASKVNCFLNITDLSEVQLCMSSNSWTWECPHTKDGADHVPLILLSSVCICVWYSMHAVCKAYALMFLSIFFIIECESGFVEKRFRFLVSALVALDPLVCIFSFLPFFCAMKWCPIPATIAGSIWILPRCVLNDFFTCRGMNVCRICAASLSHHTCTLCLGKLVWFQ